MTIQPKAAAGDERTADAAEYVEKPGRPAELDDGGRRNVYLDAESVRIAKKLGDGKVSAGIRLALKRAAGD